MAVKTGQSQSNVDSKAAVEMINIYTSNNPATFREANAVLRGQPSKDVTEKDKMMFREFAKVLEKSIDILCKTFPKICQDNSPVYRGQSYCVSITDETYTFDSFLSTSKEISQAEAFFDECSSSSVLFEMIEVQGLYVSDFSIYPEEKEVLIKPTAKFKITLNLNSTHVSTDHPHIEQMIHALGRTKIPKAFIKGTMIGFTSASSALSGQNFVGISLAVIVVYPSFFI